jgi:hypothetical protein
MLGLVGSRTNYRQYFPLLKLRHTELGSAPRLTRYFRIADYTPTSVPLRVTPVTPDSSVLRRCGACSTFRATLFNRAFSELQSHYLFAEKFGRPAKGNDKGKVEGLVGYARRNFMVPIPRAASWEELNVHLQAACLKRRQRHLRGHRETIAERFERDRAALLPLPAAPYEACEKITTRVTSLSIQRLLRAYRVRTPAGAGEGLCASVGDRLRKRSHRPAFTPPLTDLRTQKWSDLISGVFANWMTSADRKYLYAATSGSEPKLLRIRFADHHLETITSLKDFRRVMDPITGGTEFSVAPDGSPIFTRDIGSQEVYALKLRWR